MKCIDACIRIGVYIFFKYDYNETVLRLTFILEALS